jgi:hypothetical protein
VEGEKSKGKLNPPSSRFTDLVRTDGMRANYDGHISRCNCQQHPSPVWSYSQSRKYKQNAEHKVKSPASSNILSSSFGFLVLSMTTPSTESDVIDRMAARRASAYFADNI